MNLRQLKAFQAVCRTGSITRASELIHLSQPALTRQIQELESYCGCKLFERTRHGIVLTDEGELLQVRAEEMLSLAERTRRELKEAGGFTGASSGSAALNLLLRRNFHSSSRSGSNQPPASGKRNLSFIPPMATIFAAVSMKNVWTSAFCLNLSRLPNTIPCRFLQRTDGVSWFAVTPQTPSSPRSRKMNL